MYNISMKKYLKILLVNIFALFLIQISYAADDSANLRDYDGIELSKGTFFSVISLQEISTLYADLGTKVEFLSTTNLYLNEVNIIPKGTKFFGYVDLIHEPVVGTHASMRIKIVKLQLPDGYEMPMRGYVYSSAGFIIGGGKTEPETYIRKRSERQGFYSMTGYVPGPALKKGEHTVIASGANLIITLVAPLFITHTVTN